jgi:nucleotide-binding universal stress UspA family protein
VRVSEPVIGGIRAVLHPTDLSEASDLAFAHALKIALRNRASLTILHSARARPEAIRWSDFPRVRRTLEQWGLLPPGADRGAVLEDLGVKVRKVVGHGDGALAAVGKYLQEHPVDLLVLATEGRGGLPAFLRPSTAEPIARKARVPTLFVRAGTHGLVSPEDGAVTLKRVLIPVDESPDPWAAMEVGMRSLRNYGSGGVITLLHVGDRMPDLELIEAEGWTWEQRTASGPVVRAILDTARDISADIIIMVTEGRHGVLDALRGSTTEQVLRGARCPVMAVPEL